MGDGAVTGTWVGPVRTIIFHEPALASAFAGVTGGRISVEGMSLLQLELAKARTIEDRDGDGSGEGLVSRSCASDHGVARFSKERVYMRPVVMVLACPTLRP